MTRRRLLLPLLVLLAALGLGACGGGSSSSDDAGKLVRETFGSGAKVRSGKISLLATISPQGLAGLAGPVQLRFGGPFERPATPGAPRFAFTLSGSAVGRSFSAGVTSTGAAGFLALSGKEYALPPAEFAAFKKSFASVQSIAQPKTSGSGDVSWLSDPKVVGDADVSGTATTHVTAGVDVAKLLDSLARRGTNPRQLTASQRQGVLDAVKAPRFDFYTGKSDHVLRRVQISFRVDVPPNRQAAFAGLRTAGVTLDYSIADLNQPQAITAPRVTGTQRELNVKLASILAKVQLFTSLASGGGGTGATGSSGSGSSGSGSASALERYQACLTNAVGDAAATQKCQRLLSP